MDKNFEIKKILLVFLLTTILGSVITFVLKKSEFYYQHKQYLIESEKAKAEKCFEEISTLLDTRMYKMRKIFWAYEVNKPKNEIDSLWRNYSKFLQEWNNNLNKNSALVARYFGKSKRNDFEAIHGGFRTAEKLLENLRDQNHLDSTKLKAVEKSLDIVNPKFYFFGIDLQQQIETEKVGVLKMKMSQPTKVFFIL